MNGSSSRFDSSIRRLLSLLSRETLERESPEYRFSLSQILSGAAQRRVTFASTLAIVKQMLPVAQLLSIGVLPRPPTCNFVKSHAADISVRRESRRGGDFNGVGEVGGLSHVRRR